MELIVRNARLSSAPEAPLVDIGVEGGQIVAIEPHLAADAAEFDAEGLSRLRRVSSRRTSIWTNPASLTGAGRSRDGRPTRCHGSRR